MDSCIFPSWSPAWSCFTFTYSSSKIPNHVAWTTPAAAHWSPLPCSCSWQSPLPPPVPGSQFHQVSIFGTRVPWFRDFIVLGLWHLIPDHFLIWIICKRKLYLRKYKQIAWSDTSNTCSSNSEPMCPKCSPSSAENYNQKRQNKSQEPNTGFRNVTSSTKHKKSLSYFRYFSKTSSKLERQKLKMVKQCRQHPED